MVRTGWRRFQAFLIFVGLLLIIAGAAGPRWGTAAPTALLTGKDIVVVLDASRSMLAEQPSRLERARRCLRDLADELERRGGHRVALVVFAARAKLVFPLTGDYGHFRYVLDGLDPDDLPPEVRPQAGQKVVSGTRIGEALRLAVAAHDPKRPGWRDIILLSDGDDPADDEEWLTGTLEARRQQLPVHVVAVGDPSAGHAIPKGSDVLRFDGEVIQSRLSEPLLQEIARRTDGLYFPAHLHALPLGRLLRGYLAESPPLEETPAELTPVETESRQVWFLLGAFALLALSMLIGDGPRPEGATATPGNALSRSPPPRGDVKAPGIRAGGGEGLGVRGTSDADASRPSPPAPLPPPARSTHEASPSEARGEGGKITAYRQHVRLAWFVLLLPALISAAPLPSVDDLVRQGNEAFGQQDYEAAIAFYEQAETNAVDPGLIAFNKASALFRLGRYADAAAHWQRCLEDGAIAPERKARAAYDLGTALVQQSGDKSRRVLEQAVTAFRQCLDANPDADLRADALHNLELARWLWLRARASGVDEPPDSPQNDKTPQTKFNGAHSQRPRNGADPGHDNGGAEDGAEEGAIGDQKKLAQGALTVLPDQDKLVPLPPEETLAALERLAARIRLEGRAHRRQAAATPPGVKDW